MLRKKTYQLLSEGIPQHLSNFSQQDERALRYSERHVGFLLPRSLPMYGDVKEFTDIENGKRNESRKNINSRMTER